MKTYVQLNKSGAKWYLNNIDIYGDPSGQFGEHMHACIYVALCRLLDAPIKLKVIRPIDGGLQVRYKTPFGEGWNNICKTQLEPYEESK